jgi:NhaP-type Na+/H+ or K+/H+ antiporter
VEDALAAAVIAGLVIAQAAFSTRLQRAPVTPPLLFLLAGLLLGPDVTGVISAQVDREVLDPLAEVTLVIVLFGDAARLDLRRLRGTAALPARLLGIGLPLTVLAGAAAAAWVVPGLTGWPLVVLGAVLAPTDATLGQAVVSDERVPVRIRQTLNVESGLNDGLALPAVTIAIAATLGEAGAVDAATFVLRQVGLGLVAGILVGAAGGRVIDARVRAGAMGGVWQQLATLAVAFVAWGVAEAAGGNGFVAAFVAGMAFRAVASHRCETVVDFTEDEGQLLVLLTFLFVGASLVGPALRAATPRTVLYAVLSLTVVRMVPVALSLLGTGLRAPTVLFLGWFGPRGLASILFGLLVVEQAGMPEGNRVLEIVVLTATLSAVLHGTTAAPLAGRYAAWADRAGTGTPELGEMPELRPRVRFGVDPRRRATRDGDGPPGVTGT